MLWLKRVIARLLGTQTPPLDNPVQPTQTVGLVNQTPTTLAGNKRSVQRTKPPKSPVRPRTQKEPKAAQSTTAVAKSTVKKLKPVQTAKSRKASGNSTPIPVSKTPLHAKLKAKPKL